MSLCPLCERQLLRTGAYLASSDYDGQWFTFAICADCRQRQARLPRQARQRQDITAAHKVIKRPDRYEVSIWQSGDEAKLYADFLPTPCCVAPRQALHRRAPGPTLTASSAASDPAGWRRPWRWAPARLQAKAPNSAATSSHAHGR